MMMFVFTAVIREATVMASKKMHSNEKKLYPIRIVLRYATVVKQCYGPVLR